MTAKKKVATRKATKKKTAKAKASPPVKSVKARKATRKKVAKKNAAVPGFVQKATRGRPSSCNEAVTEEICARMMLGESLKSICKDAHIPHEMTVTRWLIWGRKDGGDSRYVSFCEQYTQARKEQAHRMIDEIVDICDDGSNDWMERHKKDGSVVTVCDHEHVSRSKLRIDTRKWAASKVLPKVYGDKIDITSGDEKIESGCIYYPVSVKPVVADDDRKR